MVIAARRFASPFAKPAASSELGRQIAVDFKTDADLDEGRGRPSHDQFLSTRCCLPSRLQSLKQLHDTSISVPCARHPPVHLAVNVAA
jgi:hypothetical protein